MFGVFRRLHAALSCAVSARVLSLLLMVSLLTVSGASYKAQAQNKKYTVIGDSISVGYYADATPLADGTYAHGFAAQVRDELIATHGYDGASYHNRSVAGATTTNTFSPTDPTKGIVENQLATAVADNPDFVTLTVGGNDVKNFALLFGSATTGSNTATFTTAFSSGVNTILSNLRSNAPGRFIFLTNVPKLWLLPAVYGQFPGADATAKQAAAQAALGGYITAANNAISSAATTNSATVIDLYGNVSVTDPSNIAFDGFHPNRNGHDALAQAFLRAINKVPAVPSLVVNVTADHDDGVCGSTDCTLREAINAANSDGVDSAITFDETAFAAPRKAITVSDRLPAISSNLSITSPTAGVLVKSTSNSTGSLFTITSGTVTLTNLTIQSDSIDVFATGGTLMLEGCTLQGSNFGFANQGMSTLQNCTITGHGNYGIENISGTTTLQNCTNTGDGFGLVIDAGTVNLSNSIVAGNINGDVTNNGTLNDDGTNITGDTLGQVGLDTTLKENGGPTPTIALLTGSPAINAGNSLLKFDQRGVARPQGSASDIGAFEVDKFLSVSIPRPFSSSFSEAAGAAATKVRITRTGDLSSALNLSLRSSDTSEVTIQSSATILAGDSFVDVPVDAVDDAILDGAQSVLIKATASGYVPEKATLSVSDNEVAPSNLSLRLLPSAFSEAKSGTAATLVIQHNRTSLATAVNVDLSSNDARLNLPESVQIPEGKRSVEVAVTVTADNLLTGTKSATITADASNFTPANTTAIIYDAQARISLSLAPDQSSTIKEGATNNQTTLRVTRNTPSTGALVVTLSLNKGAGQVSYPPNVTIADGASYADFIVSSVDDSAVDGIQSVVVLASATGYGTSTAQLYVQDNDAASFSAFKAPTEPSQ